MYKLLYHASIDLSIALVSKMCTLYTVKLKLIYFTLYIRGETLWETSRLLMESISQGMI